MFFVHRGRNQLTNHTDIAFKILQCYYCSSANTNSISLSVEGQQTQTKMWRMDITDQFKLPFSTKNMNFLSL